MADWREEFILRSADNRFLNIYSTGIPTDTRIYTLLHDPQYRVAVAWQNSAYNQPPHPSFYIGGEMEAPPKPNIVMVEQAGTLPVKLLSFNAGVQGKNSWISWSATNEANSSYYIVERSKDGVNFKTIGTVNTKGNNEALNRYSMVDNSPY